MGVRRSVCVTGPSVAGGQTRLGDDLARVVDELMVVLTAFGDGESATHWDSLVGGSSESHDIAQSSHEGSLGEMVVNLDVVWDLRGEAVACELHREIGQG